MAYRIEYYRLCRYCMIYDSVAHCSTVCYFTAGSSTLTYMVEVVTTAAASVPSATCIATACYGMSSALV